MWSTTAQIKAELGLLAPVDNPELIRTELKQRLAALHPDRSGGNGGFTDEATERAYHRVNAAIAFLDSPPASRPPPVTGGLVHIDDVVALAERLFKAQTATVAEGARRKEVLADTRTALKRATFTPKVTSGGIASAIAASWVFAGQLQENSIFGQFLNISDPLFATGTGLTFVYASLFYVFVWFQERVQERRAEFLMSDAGLRYLGAHLMETFTRSNLSDLVQMVLARGQSLHLDWQVRKVPRRSQLLGLRPTPGPALVDEIVDVQIERLERRGAIELLPKTGLDPAYRFVQEA